MVAEAIARPTTPTKAESEAEYEKNFSPLYKKLANFEPIQEAYNIATGKDLANKGSGFKPARYLGLTPRMSMSS